MIFLREEALNMVRSRLSEQIDLDQVRSVFMTLRHMVNNSVYLENQIILKNPIEFELSCEISTFRHGTFSGTLVVALRDTVSYSSSEPLYPLDRIFSNKMISLGNVSYWVIEDISDGQFSNIQPRHGIADDKRIDMVNIECIDRIGTDESGYVTIYLDKPKICAGVGGKFHLTCGTIKAHIKEELYQETQKAFERFGRYDLLI